VPTREQVLAESPQSANRAPPTTPGTPVEDELVVEENAGDETYNSVTNQIEDYDSDGDVSTDGSMSYDLDTDDEGYKNNTEKLGLYFVQPVDCPSGQIPQIVEVFGTANYDILRRQVHSKLDSQRKIRLFREVPDWYWVTELAQAAEKDGWTHEQVLDGVTIKVPRM
jgi:hypothetical protein